MNRKAIFTLLFLSTFILQTVAQSSFNLSHLLSANDPLVKNRIEFKEPFPPLKTGTALFENYLDEIPGTNLIGSYKLDGDAQDSTGNNAGTTQGTFTTTENRYGEAGKAMVFNGTSNYISTANSYNNPGQFTVSIWFKTNTTVGGALIGFSSQKTGDGGNRDRVIYMNSAGKLIGGVVTQGWFGAKDKNILTSSSSYNDNKWHMVTMTVGPNGFSLYVDGDKVDDKNVKSAENYTGYWRIGHDDLDTWNSKPSSFFFDGALDDALVYHRQLSAEEVKGIYYPVVNATVANSCLGQSTGSIAASASGGVPPYLFNIAGGTFSSNNIFANLSVGNHEIQVKDANNRVTLEAIKVGIQSLSQVPENGMIGFYKMSGNANDEFGNNNGTLVNSPASSADRYNIAAKAYSFNGSNQHIYIANQYNNPQEFTLSIWFKTNTTTGGKLIGFGNSQTGLSSNNDRQLYMTNSGQIVFGVYNGSNIIVPTANSYNDDQWHHALATFSPAGLYLYMDGVLSGSNTQGVSAQNYKGYWRIGGDQLIGWTDKPNSNYFKGTLDEALIYNRAVTPEEINTIYQSAEGAGNNGPVCAGATLNLTSTSLPGATYSWTGAGGYTSSQQNPTFLYTNTSAGKYTVTVTSSTGCVMTAETNVGGLNNPGQWTGNVSSDWSNASNWCDGLIPTTTTNVTITAGVAHMPVINSAASVHNINIAPGATLTTQSAGTLNISGLLTNKGSMNNSGTTVFNGTSGQQTYSGVRTFYHLTINNIVGLQLPDSVQTANVTIQSGTLSANEKDMTITGNWINNSGTGAFDGGSAKVRMIGTTPQTIGGTAQTTFSTLYASNVGSTITSGQNIIIQQNLIVGGVFDIGAFTVNRQTAGGTLYVNAAGHLKIGGTNSLPTGYNTNTFLLASKVEYSGTAQTISGQNYGTLILSSSSGSVTKTASATQFSTQADFIMRKGNGTAVSFSNNANLSIGKNLLLEGGATLQANASTISVNGNWQNDGTFNGMTGKVILAGSSSSVEGTGIQNFNDLTIAGSYVTFSNHSLTLTGNFETIGQGVFTQSPGGTLAMTGDSKTIKGTGISIENLIVSGSGKVTIHPSLIISGNLNVVTATNSINTIAGSTITMSGTTKTITGAGSLSFVNLNITGSVISSSAFSISGGLNVGGTFSASTQTATFNGSTSLSGKADLFDVVISGTKLLLSSNSNLGIANTLTINGSAKLDVTTSLPNTVNYNGIVAQNIRSITYHNLTLSIGNTKTAQGVITVNNDVEIKTNTTFKSGNYTHTIFHNWTNNGTFTKDAGEIKFAGTANSTISGNTDFNILTLDHSDVSSTVILLSDVETSLLNMTKGALETGSNKIEITDTRTGSGLIWGNIQRTHTFSPGTSYSFSGVENTLSFVAPSGITTVTIHVEKGTPSNFPSNAAIPRWYNISIPNGTYTSATWRMEYDDNFLNGNDEATLEMWNNRSGAWAPGAPKTGHNLNYVETSGLTDLTGDWTLSGMVGELNWTGASSNDWNTAANWQEGGVPSTRVPGIYDIVHIGNILFNHQPTISSNETIKNLVFGSDKEAILNFASGGSLNSGDITGTWNTAATHTININAQTLTIKGNVTMGNGVAGQGIHLNIGTGTAQVTGWMTLPTGAKIDFIGNGVLKIGEMIVAGGGDFIGGSGSVEYNGVKNQEVASVNYNHLVINKTIGLANIPNATLVNGDLVILTGKLVNKNQLTIEGNVTIGSSTILENTHTVEVAGNWLNNGTYNATGIKTVFNGTGTQTISKTTFNNLEFDKPVGSMAELTDSVTISGSLIGTSGTLDIKEYFFNRTVLGGSATMTDNATLIIGANNAPTLFGNYYMAPQSTIIFNGSDPQYLQLPGLEYGNVTFRNAGLKQLTIPITVAGKLLIEEFATLQGGLNTLTLLGDWENSGTFIPQASTVVWKGTGKSITGVTVFNKVIISGSYQVLSSLTFNGSLEVTSTGVVTSAIGVNYLMHDDLTTHGTLNIAGEGIFSGDVLQTMKLIKPQFGILNVNNTGGVNPSVGWTVLMQLNVKSGASFNAGAYTHTILGNMDNKGTITSTGNLSFLPPNDVLLNFGTQFSSTGLVRLGGTGKIFMVGMPASFKNLTIENTDAAGISPSSNLTVTHNFQIKEGSVMNAGTHEYFLGGDLENHGVINAQTSKFIFNGTVVQEIISASPFHDVTIDKTSDQAILLTDVTVNGTLDFNSGNIQTGTHTLFLTQNALLTNASQAKGWINGNLNKFISSGTTDKTFEIGDDQNYTPVDIDFVNISTAGGLTVSTTAGEHPQISTSAINPERSINRYYTISTTGLAVSSYLPRFHFVAEDVDADVSLTAVRLAAYNSSSWTNDFPSEYEAPLSVKATGVNWFGDMSLGEICNPGANISYSKTVFCTNEGMAPIIDGGTLGGIFYSDPGLSIDATSGEVNLAASTPGEYVVTYFIAATTGCREFVSLAAIAIGVEGMWTGKEDSDWDNDNNWSCSGVPTQDMNVMIPSGLVNYPLITGIAPLNNLEIQTGASMRITGTLQLFGILTNAGSINLTDGVLEMGGINEQIISGVGFVNNSVEHLVINNLSTAGVSLDGPLNITGAVRSDVQGFKFITNDHLTLKSTAAGSARVGNMTGNTIAGEVTVEHYLSAHKAWRLLSIPTNTTQSIKESWQEGATNTLDDPKPGYGTQVMSNRSTWQAEGFDLYAGGGPSIKTWNNAGNNWIGVTSAYKDIESNSGYLIIIRGDRLSNAFTSPVTETTLRTKGSLKMGAQPKIILPSYGYSVIGNPYAAPVDFRKLNMSEGVDSIFYAWDPYIVGNYNLGGYQTVSEVNDWKPVPGGNYMYPSGEVAPNLQSGQAVFVHTTPVIAFLPHEYSVEFTEDTKAGEPSLGGKVGSFERGGLGGNNQKQLLRVTLFAVSPTENIVADGNVVAFSPAYSNAIDGNDALKMLAGGENFGLRRDGKILAIEARDEVNDNDTLHYYMTNVAKKPYRLHFEPVNLYRANVQPYLLDNFLQTTTPISIYDTTGIDINITTTAGSAAADRFKVIFRPLAPLAVTITSIKAVLNKNDIDVTWTVSEEEGIEIYEVEKSLDGNQFVKTHSTKALNRQGSRYSWKDENPVTGFQYYRIKIISQKGEVNYSEIIKVLVNNPSSKISVYPNPVVDGKINVRFEDQPEGKYSLRLFNTIGQMVINKMVEHKGNSSNAVIQLSDKHAKGIYRLEVQNTRGDVETIKVIH